MTKQLIKTATEIEAMRESGAMLSSSTEAPSR